MIQNDQNYFQISSTYSKTLFNELHLHLFEIIEFKKKCHLVYGKKKILDESLVQV